MSKDVSGKIGFVSRQVAQQDAGADGQSSIFLSRLVLSDKLVKNQCGCAGRVVFH
jgi:hypothetical protein